MKVFVISQKAALNSEKVYCPLWTEHRYGNTERKADSQFSLRSTVRHCCRMFTANYPLLIEHIIREAKLYRTFICNVEKGSDPDERTMRETELFWNQIMMEHALFIRGLLDPAEDELIKTSDTFAQEYAALLARARTANDAVILRQESLNETMKFRDFKTAGVQGIETCHIRSIILPLLADHVLREANHYIRLLSNC